MGYGTVAHWDLWIRSLVCQIVLGNAPTWSPNFNSSLLAKPSLKIRHGQVIASHIACWWKGYECLNSMLIFVCERGTETRRKDFTKFQMDTASCTFANNKSYIGIGNGMTPNGQQAIILTNYNPVQWRIYVKMCSPIEAWTRWAPFWKIQFWKENICVLILIWLFSFIRVQLTMSQHRSVNGLVPNRRQSIAWTNDDSVDWRILIMT